MYLLEGFTVACFNRTVSKVDEFVEGRAKGKNIIGCKSPEELCKSLKKPRKVMIMVRAGDAVDATIKTLLPYLEEGDIVIDGGNSNYVDTNRRIAELEPKGFNFFGAGVSGGEEGALKGPSIMPGGSPEAWEHLKPIFQAISAKVEDGSPCCDYVGEGGNVVVILTPNFCTRRRPLRQDGTQWYRVRGHATHLRGLPLDEELLGHEQRGDCRYLGRVEQGRS